MVSGKTSVIYLTGLCTIFRSIDAVSSFRELIVPINTLL